jgi:DNA-binding CsgD family transcriptional regulator
MDTSRVLDPTTAGRAPAPVRPVEERGRRVAAPTDPAGLSWRAVAAIDAAIRGLVHEPDPVRIAHVAETGLALDRVAECREPLRRATDAARNGRTAAMTAFGLLCAGDVASGRWDEAGRLAEEGLALCGPGHHLAGASLRLAQAVVAAAHGDEVRTRALVDAVVGWAAPRGVRTLVDEGQRVLALAALGRGDAESAYRYATTVTRPGHVGAPGTAARRVSMDLVEAAVRVGRREEACRHVQAMGDVPVHGVSARSAMLTAASTALIAGPEAAAALFEEALATPDADRWPFDQARIQLMYGEHLRRQRRAGPSRVVLGAALDTFLRLGARPWAAQARHGLRASGLTIGHPVAPGTASALTPDERTVAALAATGLTNKEIARQLMVSHHTVAARLYQVFPKLGVGSRAALRNAMLVLDGNAAGRLDRDTALVGIA